MSTRTIALSRSAIGRSVIIACGMLATIDCSRAVQPGDASSDRVIPDTMEASVGNDAAGDIDLRSDAGEESGVDAIADVMSDTMTDASVDIFDTGPAASGSVRLVSPAPGARESVRLVLRWALGTDVDMIRLEVCPTLDCASPEITIDPATGSSRAVGPLARGVHFWRAQAHTSMGWETGWSATWSFEIVATTMPRYAGCNDRSDFNGDGIADIAVGAPSESSRGAVRVYLGRAGGYASTPDVVIPSPVSTSTRFGSQIVSPGDVNGDGFGDLIVPTFQFGTNAPAYLFLGSSSGIQTTPAVAISDPSASSTSDYGVWSMHRAGDLNRDGYADVVLSASPTSAVTSAYVFYGRSYGLNTTPDLVLGDPAPATTGSSQFGLCTTGAGDFNGDGFDDLVVGARTASPSGRAYVYFGGSAGIAPTPSIVVAGPTSSGRGDFGGPLAPAGDVNTDGFADVLVTGIRTGPIGQVFVMLGGSSAVPTILPLTSPSLGASPWGTVTRCLGDANGDGFGDVAVSGAAGGLYIYAGSATGTHASADLAWPNDPSNPSAGVGQAILGLGDVDHDGFDDYAVSEVELSTGGVPRVLLFRGVTSWSTTPWVTLTGDAGTDYGSSLAAIFSFGPYPRWSHRRRAVL